MTAGMKGLLIGSILGGFSAWAQWSGNIGDALRIAIAAAAIGFAIGYYRGNRRTVGTIYTDQYAVKVWLPALLGIASFGIAVAAEPRTTRDVVWGAILLLWAAHELYLRRSRVLRPPRH